MQRETLKMVRDTLDQLDRSDFLNPLPHGAAKFMSDTCRQAIDIILDQEFDGAEILGECGFCEKLLFVEDDICSDEDGGHYCSACGKAELEAQAEEEAAGAGPERDE